MEWILFLAILVLFFISFSPLLPLKNAPRTYVVKTGSMLPVIKPGSVVVTKPLKEKNAEKGDIIAFESPKDADTTVIHRVEAVKSEEPLLLETKGDNNNAADQWEVERGAIKGIYVTAIPYLGHVAEFVKEPKGFLIAVAFPALIFIVLQVLNIKKGIEEEVQKRLDKRETEDTLAQKAAKTADTLKSILMIACLTSTLALTASNEAVAYFVDAATASGIAISVKDFVAPETPELESPEDEAVLNSEDLALDWTSVEDWENMNDPVYYIYQIATDENFDDIYEAGNVSSSETGGPDEEGNYRWRVRACDAIDNCSDWSEEWSFTVDNTAPYVKVTNIDDSAGKDAPIYWDEVEIVADIIDDNPEKYWLWIEDTSGNEVAGPGGVAEENSLEEALIYTWGLADVDEGIYWIRLEAKDGAGNKDSDKSEDKVDIEVRKHLEINITSIEEAAEGTDEDGNLEVGEPLVVKWDLEKLDQDESIDAVLSVSTDGGSTYEEVLEAVDIDPQNELEWTPDDAKYAGEEVRIRVDLQDGDGFEGRGTSWIFEIES